MTEQRQYEEWQRRYPSSYRWRRQRIAELEAQMRAKYQGRWTPEAREAARQTRLAVVARQRGERA